MRRLRAQDLVHHTLSILRSSSTIASAWTIQEGDAKRSQGDDGYENPKGVVISTVAAEKSAQNSGKGGGSCGQR